MRSDLRRDKKKFKFGERLFEKKVSGFDETGSDPLVNTRNDLCEKVAHLK